MIPPTGSESHRTASTSSTSVLLDDSPWMNGAACNSLSRRGRVLYPGERCVSGECVSANRDLGECGFGMTRDYRVAVHPMEFFMNRGIRRTSLVCDHWCHIASTPWCCFTLRAHDTRPDFKCPPSAATRRVIVPWSGESYPLPSAAVVDEMLVLASRARERASSFDGARRRRRWLNQSHLRGRFCVTAARGRTPTRLDARLWLNSRSTARSSTASRPTGRWHRATQSDHSTPSSADSRSVCTRTNLRQGCVIDCWPQAEHPRRGLSLRCSWPSWPSLRRTDAKTSSNL